MACCIPAFDAGPIFNTGGGCVGLLHSLSLKMNWPDIALLLLTGTGEAGAGDFGN